MTTTKLMWQELQEVTKKHGAILVHFQIEGELYEAVDNEIRETEAYLDEEILVINLRKIDDINI